jgi:hypothetical protein
VSVIVTSDDGRASRHLSSRLRAISYGPRDAVQISSEARPIEVPDRGLQVRDPIAVGALDRG